MKPNNAITSVSSDLSQCSFEEALLRVECFPLCTLRVHPDDALYAQRLVRSEMATEDEGMTCPRVHIVIDETYEDSEWSVEYNGRIFWSKGA
jgi:hypothetical protein